MFPDCPVFGMNGHKFCHKEVKNKGLIHRQMQTLMRLFEIREQLLWYKLQVCEMASELKENVGVKLIYNTLLSIKFDFTQEASTDPDSAFLCT